MPHWTRRLIARDPVTFFLERRAYNKRHSVVPSLCAHRGILDEVIKSGICVIEEYVDRDAAAKIRSEVSDVLFRLREGRSLSGFRTTGYPEYGTYVLHQAERFSPSSSTFMKDAVIASVASALAGGRAVSYDMRAELRSEPGKNSLVDDWHRDTWKFRFKAMLYLTDVTVDNAPLRYLEGSHARRERRFGRFWLDYLGYAFEGEPVHARYAQREAAAEGRNPALHERVCTGPAGTLILFDTRGLHRGSPLIEPCRIILNHAFVVEDEVPSSHQ